MEAKVEYVKDDNRNICWVIHFGSVVAARAALDSLKDCYNCTNCENCTRCYSCNRCRNCSACVDCNYCNSCSYCYRCIRCKNCHYLKVMDNKSEINNRLPKINFAIPNIHSRIYASASQPHALDMEFWHTCKNTHCRAGWAITLAGENGALLEKMFSPVLAALIIYDASDPTFQLSPARFFDDNDAALDDMKECAEWEAHSCPD